VLKRKLGPESREIVAGRWVHWYRP